MKRREFLGVLGGAAAAWPLATRAQHAAIPAIGYLSALSERQAVWQLAAFRRGLSEYGFVEGRNVVMEFRWADGVFDRLPALAADLVRRPVNLILAQTPPAALAAKAATTTIPIVFVVGFDPVAGGLVTNLARPGGNITGMSLQQTDVASKRLALLLELSSKSPAVAMIVNPNSPNSAPDTDEAQKAASTVGVRLKMFNASTPDELDAAFAAITRERPDALLVGADPFLVNRINELVTFATRLRIPAAYPNRAYVDAGGLMSYGTDIATVYRQSAAYAGRILRGEKPADLPVTRPTKFELVIKLRAAKMIGVTLPNSMQLLADEVIE